MAFAQQNYHQRLGNSPSVTIADEGCLLTSISNLLTRSGQTIDPPTLNDYFLSQGVYTYDSVDHAKDDLAWDSISRYDGTIVIKDVGSGGLPSSNDAIVKFHYQGVSRPWLDDARTVPNMVDHYCLVDHIENGQVFIIDSWDGQLKGPSAYQYVYHQPVAWATYIRKSATPPAPPFHLDPAFTPKQVRTNKSPTKKYGLMWADPINSQPVAERPINDVFVAVAKVIHNNGHHYYRDNINDANGYEVGDCDDYTPPAPAKVTILPNVHIPVADTYKLKGKIVVYYGSANDAGLDRNALGTIEPLPNDKPYFVYEKQGNAWHLSRDNMKDDGYWIDITSDKVEVPAPPASASVTTVTPLGQVFTVTPSLNPPTSTLPVDPPPAPPTQAIDVSDNSDQDSWKVTNLLRSDGKPVMYAAINTGSIQIRDLDKIQPAFVMRPFNRDRDGHPQLVPVVSTFVKDGVTYARTQKVAKEHWYYGVPMEYLNQHQENIFERTEHAIEEDNEKWMNFLTTAQTRFKTLITDVTPQKLEPVKQRSQQFTRGVMDVITKKGKK